MKRRGWWSPPRRARGEPQEGRIMSIVASKPMTAEEFWDWLHQNNGADKRWELVNGEIEEMPPPGELHGVVCAWIAAFLWQFVIRRGHGRVCSNDTGLVVTSDPDTV